MSVEARSAIPQIQINTTSGSDPKASGNQEPVSTKARFVQRLKQFLYQEKGEHIYDHLLMDIGQFFYEQLKNGTLT